MYHSSTLLKEKTVYKSDGTCYTKPTKAGRSFGRAYGPRRRARTGGAQELPKFFCRFSYEKSVYAKMEES